MLFMNECDVHIREHALLSHLHDNLCSKSLTVNIVKL